MLGRFGCVQTAPRTQEGRKEGEREGHQFTGHVASLLEGKTQKVRCSYLDYTNEAGPREKGYQAPAEGGRNTKCHKPWIFHMALYSTIIMSTLMQHNKKILTYIAM